MQCMHAAQVYTKEMCILYTVHTGLYTQYTFVHWFFMSTIVELHQ